MIKAWTDEAWEDFIYWTKQDKKNTKKNYTAHKGYRKKRL